MNVPIRAGTQSPVIVVPCFNEERRLDEGAFIDLVATGILRLLFVNDGSDDGTDVILERLIQKSDAITMLELPRNCGKGEAVRRGLQMAVQSGTPIVGYFDADLATPGSELLRMLSILDENPDLAAVFGSRIARLGSHIERSAFRHYTGRIFATAASLALGVAVYDTQCGAKVLRVNENLRAAIQAPFRSAWSFDVLLCQRLLDGTEHLPGLPAESLLEMPLERWSDRSGSKVDLLGSFRALHDVITVGAARRLRARQYPRRRRSPGSPDAGSDR